LKEIEVDEAVRKKSSFRGLPNFWEAFSHGIRVFTHVRQLRPGRDEFYFSPLSKEIHSARAGTCNHGLAE
jgi:hypothetical protein